MFVDVAKVFVSAGKGGDGAVSFRHEIYVDKGGPDGGDGGRGGDVIFRADSGLNTLVDFRYKPELRSKPGENGSKRNKRGGSGEDLVVKVPIGTIVKVGGETVADFTFNGQEIVIAKGGDGGFGNAHFKSSVRQTPRVAEKGEQGDTFEAELELKLLADVGLVGFPNAGKSTFLSVVSNARPEIADYPFTTLTPNLGVAYVDENSLLIADIPGLIEGASQGKGLGDAFLRHVERTSVLLHLIDVYSDDVAKSYQTIREELKNHNSELVKRPEVIALTKIEGVDQEIIDMQIDSLKKVSGDSPIMAISSSAKIATSELLRLLVEKVEIVKATEEDIVDIEDEFVTISLSDKQSLEAWSVEKTQNEEGADIFVVIGEKIEKFARKTNFDNPEGVDRLRNIMKKMGIWHELIRKGAVNGSLIQVGESFFEF